MLFIERNEKGDIVAIRQGKSETGHEPVSLLDEEVLAFLKSTGEIETFAQLLFLSDGSFVRVLEDLVDLLIAKKMILFTELPPEAQEKIRERKRIRAEMNTDQFMVDDIL